MSEACCVPDLEQAQEKDFEIVIKDEQSGYGVLSYRGYNRGDLIAEMRGEIIAEIRQHTLQIKPGVHLHDLEFSGYLLHSCSPNVRLDMKNLRAYAKRRIRPNEFLYMDYAQTEDYLFRQFPCSCGAKNCRGWITGKKQVIDEQDPLYQEFMRHKVVAV